MPSIGSAGAAAPAKSGYVMYPASLSKRTRVTTRSLPRCQRRTALIVVALLPLATFQASAQNKRLKARVRPGLRRLARVPGESEDGCQFEGGEQLFSECHALMRPRR